MSIPGLAIRSTCVTSLDRPRALLPSYLAAFAAIYLVWGSTFLAVEVGLRAFAPFQLMAVRSLAGGAILLTWVALTGRSGLRREWGVAAASGVLLFAGGHGLS